MKEKDLNSLNEVAKEAFFCYAELNNSYTFEEQKDNFTFVEPLLQRIR